jgi:hypothetical protein
VADRSHLSHRVELVDMGAKSAHLATADEVMAALGLPSRDRYG